MRVLLGQSNTQDSHFKYTGGYVIT